MLYVWKIYNNTHCGTRDIQLVENIVCGTCLISPVSTVFWIYHKIIRVNLSLVMLSLQPVFNPFPHIDVFWCICSRRLFKTSNFSFCHNVFNFFSLIIHSFLEIFHNLCRCFHAELLHLVKGKGHITGYLGYFTRTTSI